jgi:Tfp pilus assembly protein PilO
MNINRALLGIFVGGLIGNLLLFGVGSAFHIFFIRPAHENFKQAKHTLANLKEQDSSLRAIAREVEQRNDDMQRLNQAFLDPDNIVSFVTLLETMALNSNVSLTIVSADVNADKTKITGSVFTLSITGSLNNIMQFVTLAENLPYFTEIASFTTFYKGDALTAQIQIEALTL